MYIYNTLDTDNHTLALKGSLKPDRLLGGDDWDYGKSIVVDTYGNAYVTGYANLNFPMAFPVQGSSGGDKDIFITKIDASGTSLIYSTYLGGNNEDIGWDIAVDNSGNAYITGWTESTNFPTASPIQGSYAGGPGDVFVTKIDASGASLTYSTYIGGSAIDHGYGIDVDGSGNTYITGVTSSDDFPVASPIQKDFAGGWDAFVTKINAAGTIISYSTYLGGSVYDYGREIAVDEDGNAYIIGDTESTDFPTTASPLQATNAGDYDAFVTKINTSGSSLSYTSVQFKSHVITIV